MKNLLIFLLIMLFLPACNIAGVEFNWHTLVAIIVGLYEVVVRIIPTIANYSLIGKIIDILSWISNFLDNKKKRK